MTLFFIATTYQNQMIANSLDLNLIQARRKQLFIGPAKAEVDPAKVEVGPAKSKFAYENKP